MARRQDAGDADTTRIGEFFRQLYPELIRYLLKKGATEPDAWDVAQNCYLRLSKPDVKFLEKRFPKAYLLKTAIREWWRASRLHRDVPVLAERGTSESQSADFEPPDPANADFFDGDTDAASLGSDEMPDALALGEELASLYAGLSKDEKWICNLMIEGMDADDIVESTGLTRDQVERRMTSVRKRLRRLS